MKFTIGKGDLQRGLARIQSIVEKRNTMPILANVHLEARKDAKEGVLDLAADRCTILVVERHVEDGAELGLQRQGLAHALLDTGIVVADRDVVGRVFAGLEEGVAGMCHGAWLE